MKTNITLKLDRELLRRAKVLAAERDTSVSALVAEQLEKAVREREGYEQARRRALAILKKGFDLAYKPPASRDDLHER
jgi:predicted transcriptional regulator